MGFTQVLVVSVLATLTQWMHGIGWKDALDASEDWYGSDEAREVCEAVLAYQFPSGGWPKNHDMSTVPSEAELAELNGSSKKGTIDNGATYQQIEFLSKYFAATGDPMARAAAERGLEFLLEAQYANGGWPMFYPLQDSYHDHVTYNDNAMVGVLNLFMDIRKGKEDYAFIGQNLRSRVHSSLELGIDCILKTQVVVDGVPTVWCAQHDENTLEPAAARNFEPVSLSGAESVQIIKFLMRINPPNGEVKRAIEGAVAWLEANAVTGIRLKYDKGEKDRILVTDPDAPRLWARFYELDTNRPIFVGRDKVVRYDFMEVERERRAGYSYFGDWAEKVLERNYAEWRERWIGPDGELLVDD